MKRAQDSPAMPINAGDRVAHRLGILGTALTAEANGAVRVKHDSGAVSIWVAADTAVVTRAAPVPPSSEAARGRRATRTRATKRKAAAKRRKVKKKVGRTRTARRSRSRKGRAGKPKSKGKKRSAKARTKKAGAKKARKPRKRAARGR